MASRRPAWSRAAIVAVAALGLAATGCGEPDAEPQTSPTTTATATSKSPAASPTPSQSTDPTPEAGTALAVLEQLPVKGRAPTTGYNRDQFGPSWTDVDGNGCDTRNDILTRDLRQREYGTGDGCTVTSGLLAGPYSREWIWFTRGEDTSSDVQIDHVVSLSDAWQKGAQQLTEDVREAFANDPLNLLAVDGPLNMQKSDGDAATWLPPNQGFRCRFVAYQVAVKDRYELWVTQAEKDAIAGVLASCPDQKLPDGSKRPAVKPPGPPPPPPQVLPAEPQQPTDADVYYENCTAARDAGAAPIRRGDPGYGSHLDRDGDGVACE